MATVAGSMPEEVRSNGSSMVFLKIMAAVLSIIMIVIGFFMYANSCTGEVRREAIMVYATKDSVTSLKEDIAQVRKEIIASRQERREDMARIVEKLDRITERK